MPSPRTAAAYLVMTLLCGHLEAQVEVLSVGAPEGQQVEASEVEMRVKGGTDEVPRNLPIPLDDTGFADWRFVNPRSPLQIEEGVILLFINQTPDRIFEVTTRLSLNQASFAEAEPSTLPLLVYDAFTFRVPPPGREISAKEVDDLIKGKSRERIGSEETLKDYEARLYGPHLSNARFGAALEEVLELESAIRHLADATKGEKDARAVLVSLTSRDEGEKFDTAKSNLGRAINARTKAEEEVRRLRFGRKEVEDSDYLSKVRKALIDELEARKSQVLKRQEVAPQDLKSSYQRLFHFLGRAVEALKKQSPEASQIAPLGRALPSLRLADCSVADTITCSATIQVYQNGTNSLPYEVLLFQADPASPAKFTIKFFGEEESPAKSTAYLVAKGREERFAAPKSSTTLAAVASVGVARDPFIPKNEKSLNCPVFCASKPYEGSQRTHYPGAGRIEVVQTFGNLFDGKVSIGFKEGDLGQDGTLSVKLSQYRFNLYSQPGWTFHYGKYTFAAPSSGIAINESGEGLRLAFRNYGLARIIKRENIGVGDEADRDHEAWIFDAANLQVPVDFLRTVNVTAVYGEDNKEPGERKYQDQADKVKAFSAHKYRTYGGQVGFTAPLKFYGTVSAYRSKRTADEKNAPCGTVLHVCDGKGDVGLLTLTRPLFVNDLGEVRRTATFSLGLGTGDDPATGNRDEGYIGETASYSPDQIFLTSFANAVSLRDFVGDMDDSGFFPDDRGPVSLGAGLSNKRYLGVKYVDNSWSFLEFLAKLPPFRIPASDIRSRSTTLTLNDYQLRRPFDGEDEAGQEVDLEFTVETPRSVKVTLRGAYYWRGDAVRRFIHKDIWSASAGISLSL